MRSAFEVAADTFDPPTTGWLANPIAWVRERLGAEPWSAEAEILEAVRDHPEVAVHSCHNVGKDWTAAAAAAWWLDVHPPGTAFVVSTAPTGDQVKAILWRYIGRMHRVGRLPGRVNLTEWYIGSELVGMGRKTAEYTPEAFQGIHAPFVLVILDEASGIPKVIWDAAASLTSNEGSRTLAIGNPDRIDVEFHRVCQPGSGWKVIHIGFERTPNFTSEAVAPALAAELISPGWVESRKIRWGETSPLYTSKVLGLFPDDSDDGVVPASRVAACRDLKDPPWTDGTVQLGVDVGASETGDQTVVRERRGRAAGRVWRERTSDAMAIVGLCVQAIRESGATRVCVDVIGVGFGICGRLKEVCGENPDLAHVKVIGVNVGEAAHDPKRFVRLRSELWWEIGRELTVEGAWDLHEIDDDTAADLAAPRYTLDSSGRVKVESKDEVTARLGRSTDDADALLLAFYEPPPGKRGGLRFRH